MWTLLSLPLITPQDIPKGSDGVRFYCIEKKNFFLFLHFSKLGMGYELLKIPIIK